MKIPDSAAAPLLQMITKALPYSDAYTPVCPESRAVMAILNEVAASDENLKELEGFIYHLGEKIDKSPEKQESTEKHLSKFIAILRKYEEEIAFK